MDSVFARSFPVSGDTSPPHPPLFERQGASNMRVYLFVKNETACHALPRIVSDALKYPTVLVVPDEMTVPKEQLNGVTVYYLSCAPEKVFGLFVTDAPPWMGDVIIVLFRMVINDYWHKVITPTGVLELPHFFFDDPRVGDVIQYVEKTIVNRYVDFYREIRQKVDESFAWKDTKRAATVLIFNVNQNSKLRGLFNVLQATGNDVLIIENESGWVPGKGYEGGRYMDATEFVDLVLENNVRWVIFPNMYGMMPVVFDAISKIWIMKVLGIKGISVVIDDIIDGIHPIVLHTLPDHIQFVVLQASSCWYLYERLNLSRRAYKSPQIAPSIAPNTSKRHRPSRLTRDRHLVVISNSRFFLLSAKRNLPINDMVFPVVMDIVQKNKPIYWVDLMCIVACMRMLRVFPTQRWNDFFQVVRMISFTARTFLRYFLLDTAQRIARQIDMPMQIYGDSDWEMLFPDSYTGRYLKGDEITTCYQDNIVLDPSVSPTYLGQHPSIPTIVSAGGIFVAPQPVYERFDDGSAVGGMKVEKLTKLYFKSVGDMEDAIGFASALDQIDPSSQESFQKIFGIRTLYTLIQDIITPSGSPNGRPDP